MEEGYGDLLHSIHEALINASTFGSRDEIDMEVILSVLDYRSHPESILEKVGPAGVLLKSQLDSIKAAEESNRIGDKECERIRKRIELLIVEPCSRCNFEKTLLYYSKLFRLDNNHFTESVDSEGNSVIEQISKHVATTNYDLILERYDHYNIEPERQFLKRGFKRVPRLYEWDEVILNTQNLQNEVTYLKLHGSINWCLRKRDNNIVPREYSESLYGEEYLRRVMIYPIYGKTMSRKPFIRGPLCG